MLIDKIVTWVGLVTVVLILICLCFLCCSWLIYKAMNSVRMIRLIFRTYWDFYSSIKDLPDGNYNKFRVTWDRNEGKFTDAEGIDD
jgi:hypothetical protein